MTISLSDGAANAILESGYDAVFNSGVLELRNGTRPADANQAPVGTLIWTVTLAADAFAAAASRSKAKLGTLQANAVATGTPTWYRLKLSGDLGTTNTTDKRQDGTVTLTGGGGDMTVDNTNITSGQQVTVNTFSVSL